MGGPWTAGPRATSSPPATSGPTGPPPWRAPASRSRRTWGCTTATTSLSCSPHQSPTPSPRSSPRVSVTDDTWLGNSTQYTSSAIVAAINALSTDGSLELDGVPVKARKTAPDHCPSVALKVEPAGEDLGTTPPTAEFLPEEFPSFQHVRKGAFCDQYLSVPQHPYQWARPRCSLPPSLPALDWQLPSRSGPYELRIEVQPKPHHRAHYETEGSRGAVKASAGGHPSVQVPGSFPGGPGRAPTVTHRFTQLVAPERGFRRPQKPSRGSEVGLGTLSSFPSRRGPADRFLLESS
uniref:RHD domain-containing protein n=1 Tax=Neovison vison TaxID=452646 RepID=A0A8C7AXQ5_NEOVI